MHDNVKGSFGQSHAHIEGISSSGHWWWVYTAGHHFISGGGNRVDSSTGYVCLHTETGQKFILNKNSGHSHWLWNYTAGQHFVNENESTPALCLFTQRNSTKKNKERNTSISGVSTLLVSILINGGRDY